AVITAFRFALSNPSITAEAIEANEFPTLSSNYGISGVPDTVVEGRPGAAGVKPTRLPAAQPEPVFVVALKEADEQALPVASCAPFAAGRAGAATRPSSPREGAVPARGSGRPLRSEAEEERGPRP